jgi:hypothetical protein
MIDVKCNSVTLFHPTAIKTSQEEMKRSSQPKVESCPKNDTFMDNPTLLTKEEVSAVKISK